MTGVNREFDSGRQSEGAMRFHVFVLRASCAERPDLPIQTLGDGPIHSR